MVEKQLTDPEIDVHDEEEMQEIHNFDFKRAMLLLSVIEKQANVAPKANSIGGIAQAELNMLNDAAKDIARGRAEKARAAQQELDRKRQIDVDRANAAQRAEEERTSPNTTRAPRAIPAHEIPISPEPNEPVVERRV